MTRKTLSTWRSSGRNAVMSGVSASIDALGASRTPRIWKTGASSSGRSSKIR
ncbi:hypothetical protein [Streptomyces sp. NPDC026092]|uniref:hypothetical protein n=1 Tax=Streptomyces sp. NPDC026092 TaxID=3154797 RepID=UPI0033C8364A